MGTMSNIKKILTLNCEQASRLLSNQQDTSLRRTEQWALKLHLLLCRSCRRYKDQLRSVRKIFSALRTKPDSAPPELRISDEKRDDIKKTLREKEGF